MLFVGVFPKVPENVSDALKRMPAVDTAAVDRAVEAYLFKAVGREIELKGEIIGRIRRTEIRFVPRPGQIKPEARIYATVGVDNRQEAFVRRFLPGGESAVDPADEVGSVKGDPQPA